jgi:lipopolysaccharide heptosyltransferase I
MARTVLPGSDAPRILIVRLSAIGDVIHGLPVLNALRRRFPLAHLGWVVEGRAADLLQGHPALNRLIVVPRKWLKSPPAVWNLRRELRAERFEVTIDLQGLTKSAIAARLSGAARRIGFDGPEGRELSRWLHNERVAATAAHVIDKNLELLRPLGISAPHVEFNLPETPAQATTARHLIASLRLTSGYAIINPGAGWPSKLWPPDHYAAVARHLERTCGLPTLVVWGGAEEHAWAQEIVAAAPGAAQLAPQTSLTELAAIARRARLFIGSDTGPLHLAAAVGTPCVGLFGPMPRERNGPYGAAHLALQEVWLSGSSRARRTADNSSMRAISIASVCAACDTILGRAETVLKTA